MGRDGRFVAEGEVVLGVLLRRSRFQVESVLVSERRAEALAELLACRAPGVPAYVASQRVVDAVAGFHLHRGVLAVGRRGEAPSPAGLLDGIEGPATVVVVAGVTNHDNVGGIFRNAAAFGTAAVLLDGASCDPLYRKAIRVSVGGCLVAPFARGGEAAGILDALTGRGFEILSLSPGGAEPLADLRPAPRTALVLGAEGPGLPREILDRTRTVRIPMAGGFDSLNVATTSGIALHHLFAAGLREEGLTASETP